MTSNTALPERLTDDALAELERLDQQATPAPWTAKPRHVFATLADDEMAGLGFDVEGPPEPMLRGQFARGPDAALIAAMRNNIGALVAEVRAGREAEELTVYDDVACEAWMDNVGRPTAQRYFAVPSVHPDISIEQVCRLMIAAYHAGEFRKRGDAKR